MHHRPRRSFRPRPIVVLALLGFLALALPAGILAERWIASREARIERLAQAVESLAVQVRALLEKSMEPRPGYLVHSHTFQGANGPELKTVETRRLSGESEADWKARHAERVAQAFADFPPI